nr:hypothetical protein CFP56_00165 [Quercus suber]
MVATALLERMRARIAAGGIPAYPSRTQYNRILKSSSVRCAFLVCGKLSTWLSIRRSSRVLSRLAAHGRMEHYRHAGNAASATATTHAIATRCGQQPTWITLHDVEGRYQSLLVPMFGIDVESSKTCHEDYDLSRIRDVERSSSDYLILDRCWARPR